MNKLRNNFELRKCPEVFVDNNGKRTYCPHPLYKNHGFCVFHSPRIRDKEQDFTIALYKWAKRCEESDSTKIYDFKKFMFPSLKLDRQRFIKDIDFRQSHFKEDVDFRGCEFGGEVDFYSCKFFGKANFQASQFLGFAKFNGCVFNGKTIFMGGQFASKVGFHGCKFRDVAVFQARKFSEEAVLQSSTFYKDADFQNCNFLREADFRLTHFRARADFFGARFQDEIILGDSKVSFLKNLNVAGVNFEGAVLESAPLWNIPRLANYSFRNAVLLSLNLAGKEIVGCDFTGAIFKAVHTQGWKPDNKTIQNTQYIYTDYEVSEVPDEDGHMQQAYKPVLESRVPADGTFGQGEHANFTVVDYLREPLKWSRAYPFPPSVRTAAVNYIQFFTDFMHVTEGVEVEIRTRREGNKIRVEFMADSEEEKEVVMRCYERYLRNTTENLDSLIINFNNPLVSDVERETFIAELQLQISQLKVKVSHEQMRTSYEQRLKLEKEETNQALKQMIQVLFQTPNHTLSEAPKQLISTRNNASQRYKTPVFFLTADLKSYSKAISGDDILSREIQSFLIQQREQIQNEPSCEIAKMEGDSLKVFMRDGLKLFRTAQNIIHHFQGFKIEYPSSIEGFRVILTYGIGHREQSGDYVDFSETFIVDAVRVDQGMKKYIEEHDMDTNQIWCTEEFRQQMSDQHPSLHFDPLPHIALDKGHDKNISLYHVTLRG